MKNVEDFIHIFLHQQQQQQQQVFYSLITV